MPLLSPSSRLAIIIGPGWEAPGIIMGGAAIPGIPVPVGQGIMSGEKCAAVFGIVFGRCFLLLIRTRGSVSGGLLTVVMAFGSRTLFSESNYVIGIT